jgi:long-chain acyl-CoA synthetase
MVRRTFDLLDRYQALYNYKNDVFAAKVNGSWVKYSAQDYIEKSNFISYALLSMGLKPGDKIATVSNNRPEWNFADMGMAQIGVIHVPIYPTISFDDYYYILGHSEPSMIIISDKGLYEKLKGVIEKVPSIKWVCTFNGIDGTLAWNDLLEKGQSAANQYYDEVQKIKSNITPDDLATLIYTSGTTGLPKGVMLTHDNLISNFTATAKLYELGAEHRVLSFLPLCHVYERSLNYNFQYKGLSIYYAENLGTIIENLKEVKPHIFNTVPRLIERIYDGIIGKGKDLPYFKKMIFFGAVNLGLKFNIEHKNNWLYRIQLKVADRLVFSKWREAIGGEVRYIVCGGAALQKRLGLVFSAAKMITLEGYGLTETSPVIAVNDPSRKKYKIGTVGPILEGVEVKFADDGEILCRGRGVMSGYYKAPNLTEDVIDSDGWFHTGDIGSIDSGGFLKITDRKKEIFKLSSGKYISPQLIENKLKESFFIEQAFVVGENEKFASAIIVPNFVFMHNWCARHGISFQDNQDMISNPKVIARFQHEVKHTNHKLGKTEQIKRFKLVADDWNMQSGELSQTLKLKRKYLYDKYQSVIDDIYDVGKKNNE